MIDREAIGRKTQGFFEDLWQRGDPWDLETSEFEQQRCARLLEALSPRRFGKVLEIGCAGGVFTGLLTSVADRVVALDVSSNAIERAKTRWTGPETAEFRIANIMEYDVCGKGPWDLVVMSDMVYFLGWLYPFFDIAWLAMELFAATSEGGQLLLSNCYGGPDDYLMHPTLIHTYRDLFVNVGYHIKTEQTFCGSKNGVKIDVLVTLFEKLNDRTTSAAST
jgi:SAM-dependent methyltransferase